MDWIYSKENIKNIYPLSSLQEGMYFEYSLNPAKKSYIQQVSFDLLGIFYEKRFNRTLNAIFKRHDVLRTVFINKKGSKPLQVVLREVEVSFSYKNILDINNLDDEVNNIMSAQRDRTFDLSKGPLFRAFVVQKGRERYTIIFTFHHIILDGWSLFKVLNEIMFLYGTDEKLLDTPEPFSKFIKWVNDKNHSASINFWEERLKGLKMPSVIPKVEGAEGIFLRKHSDLVLNAHTTDRINLYSCTYNITPFIFLITCWSYLLSRFNRVNDVVLGAVTSCRDHQGISGLSSVIGLTMNTIPFRVKFDENVSFNQTVKIVQEYYLESLNHSYIRLSEVQAKTSLKNRLFDHVFVFENIFWSDVNGLNNNSSIKIEGFKNVEYNHYDFEVNVIPDNELLISFIYNPIKIQSCFVESINSAFRSIIDVILSQKEILIKNIIKETGQTEEQREVQVESF